MLTVLLPCLSKATKDANCSGPEVVGAKAYMETLGRVWEGDAPMSASAVLVALHNLVTMSENNEFRGTTRAFCIGEAMASFGGERRATDLAFAAFPAEVPGFEAKCLASK